MLTSVDQNSPSLEAWEDSVTVGVEEHLQPHSAPGGDHGPWGRPVAVPETTQVRQEVLDPSSLFLLFKCELSELFCSDNFLHTTISDWDYNEIFLKWYWGCFSPAQQTFRLVSVDIEYFNPVIVTLSSSDSKEKFKSIVQTRQHREGLTRKLSNSPDCCWHWYCQPEF